MGKNLIQQARGKGGPTYRAPSFRYKGKTRMPLGEGKLLNGKIIDLIHCQGHSAPLAKIEYEDKQVILIQAPEGVKIGDDVKAGIDAELETGNVVPLSQIPEGTMIYNIEGKPGDGGKFVKSGGCFARLVSKRNNKAIIALPSKKEKSFDMNCRACIGSIAGGGRLEKPLLKAGNKYYKMKAKNKLYPKVCGVSMNAVDHPFGSGGSHTKGRPTQSSRHAPPGRKVGKIAPKRTGKSKS